MARYVAVQSIFVGGALAFAAGSQVPEGHVERFGYLDAGWVQQIDDNHRGDVPDLATAQVDNTPPPLTPDRFLDEAARRVEQAQREFAAEQAATQPPAWIETGDPDGAEPTSGSEPTPSPRTSKAMPGTGDTTSPVKES